MKVRYYSILLLLALSNDVVADGVGYSVKDGDSLSKILFTQNIGPIYGPGRKLDYILRINPKLKNRENFRIYPGEIILLSDTTSALIPILSPMDANRPINVGRPSRSISFFEELEDFTPIFNFGFSPKIGWKDYSAQDNNQYRHSNLGIMTNHYYGFEGEYGVQFLENYSLFTKLSLEYQSFLVQPPIELKKESFITKAFSIGGKFKKTYSLEMGMEDMLFLTSPNLNKIDLKQVALPKAQVGYEKNFPLTKQTSAGLKANAKMFLPKDSTDFETKLGYGANVEMHLKIVDKSFVIGHGYDQIESENNSTRIQSSYIRLIWDFK